MESKVSLNAVHALQVEMKKLHGEPVEGFRFKLVEDSNIFIWEVAIFGPPNTLYEGGYFKALMTFPADYPYSPPAFRFLCKMWHPNIYQNGDVCISILHPPVDDPLSGELISERWNPTQSIRTVLLSIISLLNEPNTLSPANVDASVAFRRWKDGIDKEYENVIRREVLASRAEAERDGVAVPTTVEEYCVSSTENSTDNCDPHEDLKDDYFDYYHDDMDDDYNDDAYKDDDDDDDDDSGHGN